MNKKYQLLIIGAGPAGLSAAISAKRKNLTCAVIDEQSALGGQIYRSIEAIPTDREEILGPEYTKGKSLVSQFLACGAAYLPNTKVFSLNKKKEVGVIRGGEASILKAEVVIVASGAIERPVPFPGWTLPGVMHAGAGQILYKSSGVVPKNGVILAGSGPLLLLLAWQYVQAGVKVKALLDVTPINNHFKALFKLPKAFLAMHYLRKGISLQYNLIRAGIPIFMGVKHLKAEGSDTLESVSFNHRGQQKKIESDLLLSHFGVIPHTWLIQAAGCKQNWDKEQQCWRPDHDEWGNTNIDGILVAGDGAGIQGAKSAEYTGHLAGLTALLHLKLMSKIERNQQSIKTKKNLKKENHIRPFLEAYYKIPSALLVTQDDDTIVCRCEEVTAGEIRKTVAKGHSNSNDVKFFTRCGMGPCQGRQCNNAVAHIISEATKTPIAEVGHYRARPPVAPLTISQLASLNKKGNQSEF